MKRAGCLWVVVWATLAAVAGCKKANAPAPPPVAFNAHIDMAKLRDTLATNTNDEVQQSLGKVAAGVRYGYDYEAVLVELDKLSTNASLTEPQRKVVGEVTEQVKQFVSQGKPPQ